MRMFAHLPSIGLLILAAPLAGQPAPPPPRAAAPAFDAALALAQAGIAACRARGSHVAALVVDADNVPVVMLADDGSVTLAQQFAPRKTAAVIRYREGTASLAARAATDAALAAEIKADPKIGFVFPGALPLRAKGQMVGAFAVSGGAGPDQDEACAQDAMAKAGGPLR